MNERLCPTCGKQIFPTKGSAERANNSMHRRHQGKGSVYLCPYCNGWHLTHYSYRMKKHFTKQIVKQKQRDMRIFIDTIDNDGSVMVDTYQPPQQERKGIMLAFTKEPSPIAIGLSYDQALELIEALKIQTARL